MKSYQMPQARCRVGVARREITPPNGIFGRCWGASVHDIAAGVHRPFFATALALGNLQEPEEVSCFLLTLDLGWLECRENLILLQRVRSALGIDSTRLLVALSHTHAAPNLSLDLVDRPGGNLIAPYFEEVIVASIDVCQQASDQMKEGWAVFGKGRCDLARNRDLRDEEFGGIVCGFNPSAEADDTVVVARFTDQSGRIIATLTNYGCHPTTLGPENQLLSPDYVGASREVMEDLFHAPNLFVLGACGDSGPRDGFGEDVAVADKNGRLLGYAAVSAMEGLAPPGQEMIYQGALISGATLGIWNYAQITKDRLERLSVFRSRQIGFDLPLVEKKPTEALQRRHDAAKEDLAAARKTGDVSEISRAAAFHERARRELLRIPSLPEGGVFPFEIWLWQLGEAYIVGVPAEPYSAFQRELRSRFPDRAIIVSTVTNGTMAYLLPHHLYGGGRFQEWISLTGPGGFEKLLEVSIAAISEWCEPYRTPSKET